MVIDVSRVSVFASDLVVRVGIWNEAELDILLEVLELILGPAAAPHRPAKRDEGGDDDGGEADR